MEFDMTTVYLAGPLFSFAEREFNQQLADTLERLRPAFEFILPQKRAKLLLKQERGLELVFCDCLDMVLRSDVIVAILDGADTDSGTCVELGYAYAHHKPILGVRTDFRGSEDRGLNLMVSHICAALILFSPVSNKELAEEILQQIDRLVPAAGDRGTGSSGKCDVKM
jgi:nucleoside 2-deoxyribosyltransferase